MRSIEIDVVVIGGGIAGLWTLSMLCKAGYKAILLEHDSIGQGQTLYSQGIIHGGLKYALGGMLSSEAEAIADMPDRWRACLQGEGPIDLRGTNVLSEHHYMWSDRSLAARMTTFFGSKMLRGRIDSVEGDERPELLRSSHFNGSVYRLNDLVLDVPSLLQRLMEQHKNRIFKTSDLNVLYETDDQLRTRSIILTPQHAEPIRIQPHWLVLTAGKGNQGVMNSLGIQQPAMQLRPLHMVLMRQANLPPFYAHCIGASSKPRLTITSHPDPERGMLWYLGGDLAEQGVERDPVLQIEMAQRELRHLFPWLDIRHAQWKTLRIDRAEAAQEQLLKPDNAFAVLKGNAIVAWPTKLALAPHLGELVLDLLVQKQFKPTAPAGDIDLPFPQPGLGATLHDLM